MPKVIDSYGGVDYVCAKNDDDLPVNTSCCGGEPTVDRKATTVVGDISFGVAMMVVLFCGVC